MDNHSVLEKYYAEDIKTLLEELDDNTDSSVVFNMETCENIPVGATKMGGLPDLPSGITQPVRGEYTNSAGQTVPAAALPLICQINCAELAGFTCENSDIPSKGMIYIFWDGNDPYTFREKYGVSTLRSFYWDGCTAELIRQPDDCCTASNPEMKVSFSKCNETFIGDIYSRAENIIYDMKSVCEDLGIDYRSTREYEQLKDIPDVDDVSGATKLFGFRAGYVPEGGERYNCFLQINEHSGALWYSYVDISLKENMTGWTELDTSVDYDAD